MTLIKSISGIRGTIGGLPGDNLTPVDLVNFASAYGSLLRSKTNRPKVLIGRDGRISGPFVQKIVIQTLCMMGVDVIDLGLSTTPTVEMAVQEEGADGGIIITASHNPREWNALKFLNSRGEFISAEMGAKLLAVAENQDFTFAGIDDLGSLTRKTDAIERHIQAILDLPLVDARAIQDHGFLVVADCINSTGALAIPALLDALECEYVLINPDITGEFAHNPEPLPQHLSQLREAIQAHDADLGIVVDPDVDRLALMTEEGVSFGEEYTLVAVADYVLRHTPGPTVSNMSSSMALRDVSKAHHVPWFSAAVGEVNVVHQMKEAGAVIGGEGNGGVIYPELHYGRDALVGIALLLSFLASAEISMSELHKRYPRYTIVKQKVQLEPSMDMDKILQNVSHAFEGISPDRRDGVKFDFGDEWIHLRKSNTEPIIRVYAESKTEERANQLAEKAQEAIRSVL